MAKPIVPEGPITFEADPPKVSLGKVRCRLEALASDPLLGRIDTAGRADLSDDLPTSHGVTQAHQKRVGMGIGGDQPPVMLDEKQVPEPPYFLAGIGHNAVISRKNRCAAGRGNIDPVIVQAIVLCTE